MWPKRGLLSNRLIPLISGPRDGQSASFRERAERRRLQPAKAGSLCRYHSIQQTGARTVRRLEKRRILRDEAIVLSNPNKPAPDLMRRVVALVEMDGEEREMTFLANNLNWSPRSVADLYRCRWQIEVFFKQIKQTLQLAYFLGHNANAVRWQVWTALLTYVLLDCIEFQVLLPALVKVLAGR
jgi:IS4 transposase